MQIGELAEHVGASPRSLRHYEQQGLLSPARSENGYRVYDGVEITRAENVKALLDTGLTTADIREYLAERCLDRPLSEAPQCAAELPTLHRRLSTLDELIARLTTSRDRLAQHTDRIEERLHQQ